MRSRQRVVNVLALCLLPAVLGFVGCSSVGSYFMARLADAADPFALEVSIGPVADVHVNVTRWLGTAVGMSYQEGLGFHGRRFGRVSRCTSGALLFGASASEVFVQSGEWERTGLSSRGGGWCLLVSPPDDHLQDFMPETRRPGRLAQWDLDVGASLIVGVHGGFNPVEMVDFILGFVGIDIADDDHPGAETAGAPTTKRTAPGAQAIVWTPLHEALWTVTTHFQAFAGFVGISLLQGPI